MGVFFGLALGGSGGGGGTDHGALTGLADDDHLQYMPVDAGRAFTNAPLGPPLVGQPIFAIDGDAGTGWGSSAAGIVTIYGADVALAEFDVNTLIASLGTSVRWRFSSGGTAALPAAFLLGDPNTGVYWPSADRVGLSAGGVECLQGSPQGVLIGPSGSAASPALARVGDTDTGMYFPALDQIGWVTAGSLRGSVTTTAWTWTLPHRAADGSAAAPAYSFSGDTDTGMWRFGANVLGLAAGGTTGAFVLAQGLFAGPAGTAAAPSLGYSGFLGTGWFFPVANSIATSVNGSEVMRVVNDGSVKFSVFGATAVVRQVEADFVNNVASGGTADQLDNFTDLTIYANDATAIRNDIYQLGEKVRGIVDKLQAYGLF